MTTATLVQRITGLDAAPQVARPCVTPGCLHLVTEPWEDSGLLCNECAIEGELYDREARWDHVCPVPGTARLPRDPRDEGQRLAPANRTPYVMN